MTTSIFHQMAIMTALIAAGWFLCKREILHADHIPSLTQLLLQVASPSVILLSGNEIFQQEQARWLLTSFILAIVFHCLFLTAALLLFQRDPVLEKRGAASQFRFYGNSTGSGCSGIVRRLSFNAVYDRQHINAMDGRRLFDGSFFSLLLKKFLKTPMAIAVVLAMLLYSHR